MGRTVDSCLRTLGRELGWTRLPAGWDELWPQAMGAEVASEPADAWPGAARLSAACAWLDLPADLTAALERTRRACARQPALARLVRMGRWLLWTHPPLVSSIGPMPAASWGEAGRLVLALVLVGGVEETRAIHARRGIDPAITRATLGDYLLWMEAQRREHGVWGLEQTDWLTRHAQGALYRLGRLQFEAATWRQPFVGYRHDGDGRRVLLVADGAVLRDDGRFADAAGPTGSERRSWTARQRQEDGAVVGHPVTAGGVVAAQPVRLDLREWRVEYGSGDPALAVHIPAGEPMADAACRAAFAQAAPFFARHHPGPAPRVFGCDSWLLDPQLAGLLPETGNIVRFQAHWQLHPVPGAGPGQTLERVFGPGSGLADPGTLPRTSSLQRALVAHLEAGGMLYNGGGVAAIDR